MSIGTNPVGAWALPFSTGPSVDDPTSYKGKIDANFAVAQRVADAFAPRPASPMAMTVIVDAGYVVASAGTGAQTVTEIGSQTLAIAAAPASPNNRIDLIVVDAGTGVASVVTGTPGSSPTAPALPPGKLQTAQIAVPNGTVVIANGNITDLRALSAASVPGVAWAIAGGSADAITASYAPANKALSDGLVLGLRTAAANGTASPSFNPDGLGAKTITKEGGNALVAGDIPGALAECLLRYNAANTRWELLNPAVSLPAIGNNHLLANTSGSNAPPIDTALSALIDNAFGNTSNDVLQRVAGAWTATTLSGAIDNAIGSARGAILERGAAGWATIAPGSSGAVLTANGTGADPSWQAVPIPTTYGAVGTYTIAFNGFVPCGGNLWSGSTPGIGSTGTISGLSGTWRNMGFASDGGGSCFPFAGYLAVRVS